MTKPKNNVKNIFLEDVLEKIKNEMGYSDYIMEKSDKS